jgi:hypothetical protein
MPELPPLVQRVIADVSSHQKGMAEARAEMDATGRSAGGFAGTIKSHLSGLANESSGVGKAMKAMGVDVSDTGSIMKYAIAGGAVVAAGALADFGLKGVKAFADATSSVRQFQRASGATAEDASRFVSVANQLGISTDGFATSMFRLGRNVAQHSDVLKADGVEIARNKQGNVDLGGTLLNVADAYNHTADQGAKNKLVMDAFGRSGMAMIPILQRGRDGLKELYAEAQKHHEVFTQEDLDKGRQYTLAMREAGLAVKGLEIEAGKELAPEMAQLATTFESFVGAVDHLSIKGKDADHTFSVWTGTIGNFDKAWHFAFGGGGKPQQMKDLEKATQDEADATVPLTNAYLDVASAALQRMVSTGRLTQAQLDQNLALHHAKDGTIDYMATLKELDPTEAKQVDLLARQEAGLGDVRSGYERAANEAGVFKSAVESGFGVMLSADEALRQQADAERALSQALQESHGSIDRNTEAGNRAGLAFDSLLRKVEGATEAQLRNSNGTMTAAQAKDELIGRLQGEEARYPALRGQIDAYIATIAAIPPEQLFTAIADTGQAMANIDALRAHIAALRAESSQPIVNIGGGQVGVQAGSARLYAAGGIVDRPTLAWVGEQSRREVIIPMDDPRRAAELAHQSGLMSLLSGATGGASSALVSPGGGGGATGGNTFVINVYPSAGMDEAALADRVREKLQIAGRSNINVGLG